MEPAEYERIFRVEEFHWWYAGMQTITRTILNRFLNPAVGLKILDAGCGTGAGMATYLAEYGLVTGFDISALALQFCRIRDLTALAQASVMEIPLAGNYFDLVTRFDVLYERGVANDAAAMAEFFRVLRPQGLLLLRLPAYNWLRGQHDITIHTARRYTLQSAARLLDKGGFRRLHLTYANTSLFPLIAAKRLLERLWPPDANSSDLSVSVGALNGVLTQILSRESALAARLTLPFGLSVFAVGQKPPAYE